MPTHGPWRMPNAMRMVTPRTATLRASSFVQVLRLYYPTAPKSTIEAMVKATAPIKQAMNQKARCQPDPNPDPDLDPDPHPKP